MNIDATLAERGSRYGEFPDHAAITQDIKRSMGAHEGWSRLDDDQKEALEMVAHKIGRIINGDPNYIDSWTDIIGYTRLVEKRLIDEQAVQHEFAFDPPPVTGENRCSVGEKLAGADTLRQEDKLASDLESALRDVFGRHVEVFSVDVGS